MNWTWGDVIFLVSGTIFDQSNRKVTHHPLPWASARQNDSLYESDGAPVGLQIEVIDCNNFLAAL